MFLLVRCETITYEHCLVMTILSFYIRISGFKLLYPIVTLRYDNPNFICCKNIF